jgi:hypothetical protein
VRRYPLARASGLYFPTFFQLAVCVTAKKRNTKTRASGWCEMASNRLTILIVSATVVKQGGASDSNLLIGTGSACGGHRVWNADWPSRKT